MNILILLLMLMEMLHAECECGGNPLPNITDPNFVRNPSGGGKCGTFRCAAGFYLKLHKPETFNREFHCLYDNETLKWAWSNGEPGSRNVKINPNSTVNPKCLPAERCSALNPLNSVCAPGNDLCGEITFDDNDKTTCEGKIRFEKEKEIFYAKKVECGKTNGVWYAMDGEAYEPVPAGTNVTCDYRRASSTTTFAPTTDLTITGLSTSTTSASTTTDTVTTTSTTASTTAEPSTAPPQQQATNNLPLAIGLGVSCGVAFGILVAALVVLLYLRRSKKRKAAPKSAETTRNHSYDRNSVPKETWQQRWQREGRRKSSSSHQKTIVTSITPSSEMPSSKMEENSLGTYDTTISANRDSLGSFKD